jgi:hypothetical protein
MLRYFTMISKDAKKVKAGQKGGFIKWSKIPKEKRAAIMRKVAEARYKKVEPTQP